MMPTPPRPVASLSPETLIQRPALLASSWTWCIGMYLPVYLRDTYGWWAVLVFAVPNVIGVMLFGRFLKTVSESQALIHRHERLTSLFSLITVAFHVFFLAWIWHYEMNCSLGGSLWIAWPILIFAWMASAIDDRWLRRAGGAVYGVSLILLLLVLLGVGGRVVDGEALSRAPTWEAGSPSGAVFLLPIMVFGFFACPYLDRTFHRQYQAVGGGRAAATVFTSFGLLFSIMLIFTAVYSGRGFIWPVVIHLVIQSWLTMTLHLRELREVRDETLPIPRRSMPAILAAMALLTPISLITFFPILDYRHWFVFYGLIFPLVFFLTTVRRWLHRPGMSEWGMAGLMVVTMPLIGLGILAGLEWLIPLPFAAIALLLVTPKAMSGRGMRD